MTRNILVGAFAASITATAGCGSVTTVNDIAARLGAAETGAVAPRADAPTHVASLSLTQALELARAWAPALHRANARVLAAGGALQQAGVWSNPELGLESEDGDIESGGFDGNTVYRTRLSWQLPIYSGRAARVSAAQSELAARQVHVEHERAEVAGRVRRAYARALAAQLALTVATQAEQLTNESVTATERLQAGGEVGRGELLQAQIEHDRAEEGLAHAQAAGAASVRQLARELGLPGLRIASLADALRTSWPAIQAGATLQRCNAFAPEVRAAEARLHAAQAAVTAADRSGWPEPVLSAGTATGRGADGRETALEWGIGIGIPVFDTNRGGVAEAQGAVLEAAADHRAAQNAVLALGQALISAYELARTDLARYETHIVPHAEEALGLIQKGFPAHYSLRDLIVAQRTVAGAQGERIERLVRLNDAAVALETLTGQPLDALEQVAPVPAPAKADPPKKGK